MKKTTNKFYQRVLALMLALMLCVGMMPMAAFATEGENEPAPEVTQSEPAPAEDDSTVTDPVTEPETPAPAPETPDEDEDTPGQGTEDGTPSEGNDEQETPSVDNTSAEEPKPGNEPTEDVKPEEEPKFEEPKPVEGTPNYASIEEFMAACEAMGDANSIEATLAVLDQIESVYNRLSPEDKADEAIAAAWAYVQGYRELVESERQDDEIATLASGYTPVSSVGIYPDLKPSSFNNTATATGLVRTGNGSLDMAVGQKGSFLLGAPQQTIIGAKCGHTIAVYNPSDYCDISLKDNSGKNLVGNPTYTAGDNNGTRVFDTQFEALRPGRSLDVRVCYYANFGIVFTNPNLNTATIQCWCGRYTTMSKDVKWYRYNDVFGINVYAYYTVNFLPGGDNVTNMPSNVSNSKQFTDSYTVTTQQPSREGYTFTGWVDDQGNNVGTSAIAKWYEGDGAYVTRTLTATWEEDKTYTVTYTDGVEGETVFIDQGYEGLKAGEGTPAFEGTLPTSYTDDADNTYTFQGWKLTSVTPNKDGVQPKVAAADADDDGNIIYTATWQKQLKNLTVSKTPSEEYPVVGEEFTYTITVTNPNSDEIKVKITDVLNEKLDFVGATDGGTYDETTRTVTWTDVEVPANGSKPVTVYVKANEAGEIYNEAKIECEVNETSGNTTVTAKEPEKPEKPNPPTNDDLKNTLKLGVKLVCDESEKKHDATGYMPNIAHMTIGEVTANDGANKDLYPYTCTVSISVDQQKNHWLGLNTDDKKTPWSAEHKLADSANVPTAILYWNGTKWILPTDNGVNSDLEPVQNWHYMVIHTVHKPDDPKPQIEVNKTNEGFEIDPESGNATVDYIVTVTNKSGFDIYGLKLTDTLTPTLTGEGADATYTFRDWKVNGGEPLAVSSGANGLFHEIGMLDRNVEFADQQPVTLTYTVEIAPNSATKTVKLHNDATAYSWSKKYYTAARAFFMAARGLDDLYPDNPDISGGASDTTGDDEVSGSDSDDTEEIVIPTKYTVYYDWGTLPEGVTATLPTGKTGPEGSHFTVDTNYTSTTTIKVGDKTYKFSGWTVLGDIETEEAEGDYNGQYIMPDHDVKITGRWDEVVEPDEYTITVKYVDESRNEIKDPVTVTTTNGGKYDVTDKKVDIENYNYVGADKPLTGKVIEDTTITLTYSRNKYTYTLTYNANGGTGAPRQQTYTGPETSHNFTVSGTTPTRSGYRFTGWNTAANGTGTSYPANSTITATVADPTRTLYAQWSYITPGPDPDPDPAHTPTPTPTPDPTPSPEPTDDPTDIPDPTPPLTESPDITPTPSTPPVSPDPEPSEPPIEIPDDDTPLAPSPDVTPDDDLTEIDDEDVPLADVPKTGDDAKIWLTLALLSAAGLGVIGLMQRRTRKNGKDS